MRHLGRRTMLLLLLGLVPPGVGLGLTGDGPPASGWIAQLEDTDAARRAKAARALGQLPRAEEGAASALERALADDDRAVRAQAAIALVRLGERLKVALPALMVARRDTDETIRAEAETAWKQTGPGYRAALLYLDSPAGASVAAQNSQPIGEELGRAGLEALPAILDSLARERPNRNSVGVITTVTASVSALSETTVPDDSLVTLNTGLASGQANSLQRRKVLVKALGHFGADAAPALIEALQEREPAERNAAAEALGLIGPAAASTGAVNPLVLALDDPEPMVRLKAVQALAKVGADSDEARRAFLSALEHKDPVVRRGSAVALAHAHPLPETVAEAFKSSLGDPDAVVRLKAAEALSTLDPPDPDALRVLVALLENRTSALSSHARHQLQSLGSRTAPAALELRETVREADSSARVRAALVLANLGPDNRKLAIEALEEMAASGSPSGRLSAAEALLDLGQIEDAMPVLIAMLASHDGNMTNRAQQVFQRLGPTAAGAVPALVDALEQGDESLRLQVLSVLQRLGSSAAEAAPALVRLVGNTDPNVRNYAMNVLSQFPRLPDEAAPALLEAIDRFDAQGQSMAVSLLGKFDPKVQGVVPVLVKLLDVASQPYTRQRALQSLRQLGFEGNTEAIDALVGALDHADASVRTQAVQEIRALRTISPKDLDRIVPALISVLTGPDRKAADQMARFLAEHGAKVVRAGVEALLPRIESEDPNERVQALERFKTLTEREPAEIRPARAVLLNRAEGPAQFERMLALRLLVQSGQVEGDRMRLILEKGLNDEDPSIRVEAADGLSILWGSAETPMPGLVPVLLKLADDAHPTYRVRAFEALERLGPGVEGSLPRLLAHRDDPDPDVRALVAEGLLRMGHEGRLAAVPMIARGVVEVSGSWSWPDRWSRMFAKLQPPEAEALASLLVKRLDTQSSVLHRLVLALQELGPAAKPAVPALAALLGTASGFNTDQIVDVLAQLGPGAVEAGSERLVRWFDDPKPEVRVRAARLLLKLDPRPGGAGGRAIASMLDDASTRTLAVTALGDLRQPVPEARPKLIEMLDDPDLSVRVQAARTLLLMGPEDASAAQRTLVPMLDDPRASSSRALIARTLAESGEEGMAAALPVLIEMLRSKDPRERSQAVQALDRPSIRGASEAVPALVEMLDEPGNHYVRGRAASALSYIGPEAKPALPDIARVFLTEPMVPGYPSFISALARFGPDGLPPLVDALADAEGYARRTIPLAIGRLGPSAEPAIPALVRIATGRDESETAEVRRALLQIGPRAVSALVKALDDDNPAVRRRAALVLEEFGTSAKPAASALKAHLSDPDPDARIAAASALLMADRDADAPLPVLAAGLSQGSPDAQETAARALSRARPLPEEYAEALEDAVADGAGLTRVFAAEALGLMSGEDHGRLDRAVSVLVRSMAEPPLQSATIDALEHLGPTAEAAIPSLADYLRSGTDTNDLIRAAYAIAAIGQADSIDVLDDLFDEIDPRYRPLLIEAIAQTGPQAPRALVQQLEHDDPAVRSMVVRHLGLKARGGAKVREPIVEALRDPAVEVRIAAVQALGHLDRRAKDLAPRLAGLLDEPDPTLRAEAAIALVRIEGRVSDVTRPVLVSSVTAASYLTRWRVMQALEGVGKDVLPTLIAGLKEGDYSRLVIAEALARIGPEAEAAIPALLSALERPNPPVRARAAVALVAVGGPLEPARAALLEALEAPELDPRLHGRFERVYPGGYTPTREYNKERSTSVWLSTTYPKVISRFVPVIDLVALRREMVEALGNLGEEAADALPVLSGIADDPSESETVRKAADEARRRIESTENGDE